MMLQHLPNALTLARLLLITPFLFFLYHHEFALAFYTFFIAGITDALDGWIARHFHCQSRFGSFIDPLADKLLIASSFVSIALLGKLPWWLFMLVFSRDLTISLGVIAWYWLIARKLDFHPTFLSKLNTLLQLTLITLCLFELAFVNLNSYFINTLIVLTALTTAASFFDYVWTWGKKACLSAHQGK